MRFSVPITSQILLTLELSLCRHPPSPPSLTHTHTLTPTHIQSYAHTTPPQTLYIETHLSVSRFSLHHALHFLMHCFCDAVKTRQRTKRLSSRRQPASVGGPCGNGAAETDESSRDWVALLAGGAGEGLERGLLDPNTAPVLTWDAPPTPVGTQEEFPLDWGRSASTEPLWPVTRTSFRGFPGDGLLSALALAPRTGTLQHGESWGGSREQATRP